MTINLLTQVPEGLVMVADSMVSSQQTVNGEVQHLNFEHARKLFHLGTGFPAAAMINGAGNVGAALVSQLIRDVSRDVDAQKGAVDHAMCVSAIQARISPAYDKFIAQSRSEATAGISADVEAMTEINKRRAEAGLSPIAAITPDMVGLEGVPQVPPSVWDIAVPQLTVIVASYFDAPRASQIEWPGATRTELASNPPGSVWWWGSGGISVTRLIHGVDIDMLTSEAGSKPAAETALRYFEENAERYLVPTALDLMPMQQAIYYTEFLADVAAGYDRFKIGPNCVGGEMDVVVLVDHKLKWIHKQRLTSSLGELELAGWE